ncbi:MAG: RNA polymerase sigma factor, partial [Acidimicrobiia bacterium]|nr:RNA polymerase sigma factor [Acidimicrobiia bacterium]
MSGGERQRHGELLARSAGGDTVAFHQFYAETREIVFRYLNTRVHRNEVDDLLADTYLRAFRFAATFEDRGQPAVAWLVTIAGNVVASHYRSRARVAIGNTGDNRLASEVDDDLIDRADDAAMLEALAGLKPRQRQILELRFFQELTVAECADRLSLSEQGVRA